jgi:hypothetical protein
MGLMDKAKAMIKGRSAVVEKGIDSAVTEANKRTGSKYDDKLASGAETLKDQARKLDEDRAPGRPGAGGPPTQPGGAAGPVGDIDPETGGASPR